MHHQGQTRVFDFAAVNAFSVCSVAFYADCMHALKPVLSGYRLALMYNLTHSPGTSVPALKDSSHLVSGIRTLAEAWAADVSAPDWQVYMLDHKLRAQLL